MQHDNNNTVADGTNALSSGVQAANAAKSIAASAPAKGLAEMVRNVIFGGLSPQVLAIAAGFFVLIFLFVLILSSVNSSTLFNSEPTKMEYIVNALKGGYTQTKKKARSYIGNYVNQTYKCQGGSNSISELKGNGYYDFITEACEITIDFEPELEEFAQHIDAHSNAVNSALQLFEEGGSKEVTEGENTDFDSALTTLDENGDVIFTEYGENTYSQYDSEYVNNQSESYFTTLKLYAPEIFDYERDTTEWTFKDFRIETREITEYETVCENKIRDVDMTYKWQAVPCNIGSHDRERQVETKRKVRVQVGHITVPMTYDVTKYKKAIVETATANLVGKELYLSEDSAGDYEKRAVSDIDEATQIMDSIIADYELSYMIYYLGGSYGFGYSGLITSNGFNYLFTTNDSGVAAVFWAYSEGLNKELHTLPYATDKTAFGPTMTHQCTQFAATFFYDVYGFAALRGNGNNMADYLLKDCGRGSGCPVEFERSASPAPGAIISLYPNHVVVVDQVDDDGTVYISEGNYNGRGGVRLHQPYAGLSGFIKVTGYTIKAIAIPIRN